jgi:hypothetical protein
MRQRILGLAGGKKRRRVLLATLASAVALGAILISNALAVHDNEFQLDGNVVDDASSAQDFDWESFFNSSGAESPQLPDPSRPGFTASSFDKDFESTGTPPNATFGTSDTTTFATGSKDLLPITPPPGQNPASGWQCNFDSNVNSKIDIMNAYAVAYTDPTTEDEYLYFGLERNTNNGDANVAFWFLQGEVGCLTTGGSASFSGDHQDGDLLVVSAFTNGGDVSNVDVYRWNDPDPTDTDEGSLGETPVISDGADCRDIADPPDPPETDDACGIVNTGNINTPWLTATGRTVRNTLDSTQFYEGGVNLTAHDLGGRCFNTFLADTRSSQSLTATLFDFSLGQLGECAATMKTQVSNAGPVTPGTPVSDTATVTGNREITPTGNVTFHLCKITTTVTQCDGDTPATIGDPVGSPVALQPVTSTPSVSDASAQSAEVNTAGSPLAPGQYCFRANWPGDSNYTTALEVFGPRDADECFTVQDVSSISTAQKWFPQDTATVTLASGGTPSGTVEFSLYENGTCSGTAFRTFTDSSAPYETNQTEVSYATPGKTISWSATFTPTSGSGVVGSTTTRCERSELTINDSASPFPPTP